MLPATTIAIQLHVLFGVTVTFVVLTWISVPLRAYVRARLIRSFGWDDWAILVAQTFFTLQSALTFAIIGAQTGLEDGSVSQSTVFLLIRLANCAYALTMIAVKASLSIFFLKIFVAHRGYRILILVLLAIATMSGFVFIFMTAFTCGIETALSDTACSVETQYVDVSVAWSIINAVSDLTLAVLSVLAMRNANLRRPTKIMVSCLLVFGTIGGLVSVTRVFATLGFMAKDAAIRVLQIGRWSNVEAGICITSASLVTLRPLVNICLDKARSSYSSTYRTSSRSEPSGRKASGNVDDCEAIQFPLNARTQATPDECTPEPASDSWQRPLQTHDLV